MKIGILTFHCAHNYGAILQCYALQTYMLSLGHDVEVIDYRPYYLRKSYKPFTRHRITLKKPQLIPYQLYLELRYNIHRWNKFERFISNKLILSKTVLGKNIPDNYDIYIVGSDQIWSEHITNGDTTYMCDFPFPKSNKKYISYAASIETESVSKEVKDSLTKHIPYIDHVSVREKQQIDFIKTFTNKKVFHTIDPTLLVDVDVWEKLAKKPQIKDHYVLLYQVRMDQRAREIAIKIAKSLEIKLIEILAEPKFGCQPNYCKPTESPDEFIGWIKYADLVVTSSFHGTVFSLLFQKDFYTLSLGDGKDSRAYNLLNMMNLTNRLIDVSSSMPKIEKTDHSKTAEKIECQKIMSKDFIQEALQA